MRISNLIDRGITPTFTCSSAVNQLLAATNVEEVLSFETSVGTNGVFEFDGVTGEITFLTVGIYIIIVDVQVEKLQGGSGVSWFMWPEVDDATGGGFVQVPNAGTAEVFSSTDTDEVHPVRGKAFSVEVIRPYTKLRMKQQCDNHTKDVGVVAGTLALPAIPTDVPSYNIVGLVYSGQ